MAKGKTEIRFYGGNLDGFVDSEVSTRFTVDRIASACKAYFATSPDGGGVELRRGELNKYWFSASEDVYFKRKRQCGSFGVEYQFAGKREVGRCAAVTKAGSQCLNAAREGQYYCGTSHNPDRSPVKDIDDALVLETLTDIVDSPPITRGDIPKP